MLHEIGHSLGLGHETANLAVMNPFLNTALAGLQQDDINGIRAIYGVPSGQSLTYTMPSTAGAAPLTLLTSFDGAVIAGNASANVITGTGFSETFRGNHGNDTIYGGGGDDYINGGPSGSDTDTLFGGPGHDTYQLELFDVIVEQPGEGIDTVISPIAYTLGADLENLVVSGSRGTGNELDNYIVDSSDLLGSTLSGMGGNDTLEGRGGIDTLIGGTGNDTYILDGTADVVTENPGEGSDWISAAVQAALGALPANVENILLTGTLALNAGGDGGVNTLIGNEAANSFSGDGGNDSLAGGGGNDILDGGAGDDTMVGGAGDDTYYVDSAQDIAIESAGQGTDTVRASLGFTLGANFERLELLGTGNLAATGGPGNDTLIGNGGSNALNGMGGADLMQGGAGDDTYYVDSAGDAVVESAGQGIDRMVGTLANNYIAANVEILELGGTGNITAWGGAGADTLIGNAGNNVLDGLAGNDTMTGGAGNDIYNVRDAGDAIVENPGEGTADWIGLYIAAYTMPANVELLSAGTAANTVVTGNASANTIFGFTGNDTLNGAGGNDTLTGGLGADLFQLLSGGGFDVVTDFSAAQGDVLALVGFGISNFAQVQAAMSQQGADLLIDFGAQGSFLLQNTALAQITAAQVSLG